ncbi:Xylulose kinase [Seminavis robusta]|uniref:glycerol kinase n=1 Tax=Seminavis robusta TaxID=568900 RepID=A0A9N8F1D6_9STRA|nr:Xylulose kinase [Seminavis robusta]|eukprot:Sro2333_g323730.1 Xylulose kinase (546) ;mRNA; r:11274-12911
MIPPFRLLVCVVCFNFLHGDALLSSWALKSSQQPEPVPSKEVFVGLDVGTQGTKCLVYCPHEGRVVARSSVSYGLEPSHVQGRAEQKPSVWVSAVEDCLQSVGRQIGGYQVSGVGVSGQQHGMVALDSAGTPLRPAKLWCDVEAAEETEQLQTLARKAGYDRTFLTPGFTSPKILWMKQHEPELFQRAKWFVLPHDYIVMELASLQEQPVTDAGDASGNGFLDTTTRVNIASLADHIDPTLHDKLPRIIQPNEVAGYLNDHFRRLLGISDDKPIPVSAGSGDNMCSALGVGCVLPGMAVMSLGTSGTLFGVSDTPAPLNTPLAPFCSACGQHLPLACTMSCTGVLTQVLRECCPKGWTHEDACERLSESTSIDIGCNGLTFLPFLGGERTPNWPHATGALLGLTQQTMTNGDNNLLGLLWYRACMEAITFCLADTLQYFPSGKKLDKVLLVGGGAKNPFWRQMIADVLQCPLVFPVETESAALGAAFQAGAAATGTSVKEYVLQQNIEMEPAEVKPSPDNFKAYEVAFERYRSLGHKLFGKDSKQ